MAQHKGWHLHDGLLTWMDTGEQWQAPRWTEKDLAGFVALSDTEQIGLLATLEEWAEQ